ncbi:MAG: DMT family transporter [Promethearchaeota archaeon]
MDSKTKKGLFFGTIGVIFAGLQPIVANSRPSGLDAYLSAAMTCLVEVLIFFPLVIIEYKNIRKDGKENNSKSHVLANWKKNSWLLIFIGLIFGVNQIFYFVGYDLAGAINGAITQKTTVFFAMFLGYILLKEKITRLQIIFSIVLFLGLTIAITQFFSLVDFSITILIGVGVLLGISFLWMVGHTMTKPIFNREEATPIQMVFLRNFISGLFLIATYFIFFPLDFSIWLDIDNLIFFAIMGAVYGFGLVCWYKTLSYLDVSKASTIFAPTPITAAIFATIFLGDRFTIFHLIGVLLVIISIIVIVNQKKGQVSFESEELSF